MNFEQERMLIALAKEDGTYQELLKRCGELEMEHQKVRLAFSIQ